MPSNRLSSLEFSQCCDVSWSSYNPKNSLWCDVRVLLVILCLSLLSHQWNSMLWRHVRHECWSYHQRNIFIADVSASYEMKLVSIEILQIPWLPGPRITRLPKCARQRHDGKQKIHKGRCNVLQGAGVTYYKGGCNTLQGCRVKCNCNRVNLMRIVVLC